MFCNFKVIYNYHAAIIILRLNALLKVFYYHIVKTGTIERNLYYNVLSHCYLLLYIFKPF